MEFLIEASYFFILLCAKFVYLIIVLNIQGWFEAVKLRGESVLVTVQKTPRYLYLDFFFLPSKSISFHYLCRMLQMLPAVLWLVCWSRFRNGATIMRCCNDEVDEKERVQIASKLTVSSVSFDVFGSLFGTIVMLCYFIAGKLRCLW